jgi:hypothetical protein
MQEEGQHSSSKLRTKSSSVLSAPKCKQMHKLESADAVHRHLYWQHCWYLTGLAALISKRAQQPHMRDRLLASLLLVFLLLLCQATPTDFIITGSVDGHLKFWKKQETGIEFVKHYRAHLGAVDGE